MKFAVARGYALEKGATDAEIDHEAEFQLRFVGTVPFRNMIIALSLFSWNNTKDEWVRLAAALKARKLKRKHHRARYS